MNSEHVHRELLRLAALCAVVLLGVVAIVGSGGGGGGDTAQVQACRQSVSTGDASGGYGDGAGPGGGDGGAAGDGAGSAGPGLGRFKNALVRVEQADGNFSAQAEIDDTRGVIKFVLCGYTGPVRLTVKGKPDGSTQYYDESTRTYSPFPATEEMNVVVAKFEKNIGITILTEAAWQYMQDKFGPDGWKTAANVSAASDAIAREFNRFLPLALRVTDITRLPELISDTTATGSVGTTENGKYGIVNSGLARAAGLLRSGDTGAALKIARQIGRDLCDGVLDGLGCKGVKVADNPADLAYLVPQFGEFLNIGIGDIATTCGNVSANDSSLRVVQIKLDTSFFYPGAGGPQFYEGRTPIWLLRNDGKVFFWSTRDLPAVAYEPDKTFRQLFSQGPLLGATADGRSYVAPLFDADPTAAPGAVQHHAGANPAVEIPAYRGITSLAETDATFSSNFAQISRIATDPNATAHAYVESGSPSQLFPRDSGLGSVTKVGVSRGGAGAPGYFAVTSDGTAFSWGDNGAGQLGLGQTHQELPTQPTPALIPFPERVKVVSVTGRIYGAFAIDTAGEVWGWGGNLVEGLSQPNSLLPQRLTAFDAVKPIRQIECAAFLQCAAISSNGEMLVWGFFYETPYVPGQARPNAVALGTTKVPLPTGRRAIYIGAAGLMVYGLLDDGTLVLFPSLPVARELRNPPTIVPRSTGASCTGVRP